LRAGAIKLPINSLFTKFDFGAKRQSRPLPSGHTDPHSRESWELEHFPVKWNREELSISLLSHVLFGKPDPTHRVKPEGMLLRGMLYSAATAVGST
jgi:hypothetical protein